jgi:hypothetical protein
MTQNQHYSIMRTIKIGVAHKIRLISKMNCNYLEEVFNDIAKIWVDVRKDQPFSLNLRRWLSSTKSIAKGSCNDEKRRRETQMES